MNRTRRLLAATVVGAFLLAGTAACGSSGGSEGSSGADTTAAAGSDATDEGSADDGSTDDGSTDDNSSDGGEEQDCDATADSNNLSGDSVVLFAADQDELMESDLTDEDIAVIAADGSSMEPGTVEVGTGEMFGIQGEAGGSLDAVIIGCAGGQTLVPDTAIGFVITEPGSYPVSLDIAGTELGTVEVS